MQPTSKKMMADPISKPFALTICLCLFVLASCAGLPGGSIKTYPSEYEATVQASSDTLEELKIPVTETIADGLKTTLKARRPDGTPVVVKVVRMKQDLTEVTVKAGRFGLWDQRVSDQINDFINAKLVEEKKEEPEPGIVEEDLDDGADRQAAGDAPAGQVGDRTWERSPAKVAEMLNDSVFIIYFDQNSNELSDKAKQKLDRLVEIIGNHPDAEITLNGYTDSSGARTYNEMISEVRASMVKAYLVGKGIPAAKIKIFGHGAQKFIGSNKTPEGRRMNRRVEIEIVSLKTP